MDVQSNITFIVIGWGATSFDEDGSTKLMKTPGLRWENNATKIQNNENFLTIILWETLFKHLFTEILLLKIDFFIWLWINSLILRYKQYYIQQCDKIKTIFHLTIVYRLEKEVKSDLYNAAKVSW